MAATLFKRVVRVKVADTTFAKDVVVTTPTHLVPNTSFRVNITRSNTSQEHLDATLQCVTDDNGALTNETSIHAATSVHLDGEELQKEAEFTFDAANEKPHRIFGHRPLTAGMYSFYIRVIGVQIATEH